MVEEMNVLEAEIQELNDNKDKMSREYSQLVQEQNNIVTEQKQVKSKVERS